MLCVTDCPRKSQALEVITGQKEPTFLHQDSGLTLHWAVVESILTE